MGPMGRVIYSVFFWGGEFGGHTKAKKGDDSVMVLELLPSQRV